MMRLAALLAFCLTYFQAPPAHALLCALIGGCSCTVTATDLDFGDFSPLNGAQTGEAEVTVDCYGVVDLAPSLPVKIGAGQWGTIASRKMRASGGHLLNYNIYTTAQHSVIWGDGTGGSQAVSVSGGLLSVGHWRATRTMCGVTTPTTSTRPGEYADQIVVRIDW